MRKIFRISKRSVTPGLESNKLSPLFTASCKIKAPGFRLPENLHFYSCIICIHVPFVTSQWAKFPDLSFFFPTPAFSSCFPSAGCHRLHLLLQDPPERPGPAGAAGQPVAGGQQHHGLPAPPHPLGPLLPAGPAGAAAPPAATPPQPSERAAPAGPQVVQNHLPPPHPPSLPTAMNTAHPQLQSILPPGFIQDPVQFCHHSRDPPHLLLHPPHTHPAKRSKQKE